MPFGNYLSTEAVQLNGPHSNRKKVLQAIANLLGAERDQVERNEIFKSLLEREKLGSTALGEGVAVPHCRMASVKAPRAALLRTTEAIDFDAPDGQPVFLFCALIVHTDATDEHLTIFANLVTTLNDVAARTSLLNAPTADAVLTILKQPRP